MPLPSEHPRPHGGVASDWSRIRTEFSNAPMQTGTKVANFMLIASIYRYANSRAF